MRVGVFGVEIGAFLDLDEVELGVFDIEAGEARAWCWYFGHISLMKV